MSRVDKTNNSRFFDANKTDLKQTSVCEMCSYYKCGVNIGFPENPMLVLTERDRGVFSVAHSTSQLHDKQKK